MIYAFIQENVDTFTVVDMCRVMGVSKAGYYKWLKRKDLPETEREKRKKEIVKKIKQSFHESQGTYGSPRVLEDLDDWGYKISLKTVANIMREHELSALPERQYQVTTDSEHDMPVAPNLLDRNFHVEAPDMVWVTDITYIRTLEGWLYLATVMDLFSRKIIGLAIDKEMKTELALSALRMALHTRQPSDKLIHHSDRGSQYCSRAYQEVLYEYGIQVSMSRKGDPYDNACIESFHATIKKELIYRRRYQTREEGKKSVRYYIMNRYNERRRHSTLDYVSPNQFERQYVESIVSYTS
ncbi:IS3 family transposase [Paenalkalicoccus suaedae]|uniref:IS3 family transposase n=1 Tax=Paenalkalicoccus suaedae TaxID=2592382 RepID=A0A859FBY8_9BACI|nr:IS3 family transposase [Paenalkalicoccus suaedae]QKS70567.1 IS3 family transposase [Paenalkalicoccus suaedae]